jgi:hypothetical protein
MARGGGGTTLLLAMINVCRVGVKKRLEFPALTHLRGLRWTLAL